MVKTRCSITCTKNLTTFISLPIIDLSDTPTLQLPNARQNIPTTRLDNWIMMLRNTSVLNTLPQTTMEHQTYISMYFFLFKRNEPINIGKINEKN